MTMPKGSISPDRSFFPKDKSSHESRAASMILLMFGSGIIFFLFVTILLASTGFLGDLSISPYHFYFSLLALLAFIVASCFLFPFRHRLRVFVLLFGLLAASFYLSFEVSKSFFDISYDGQAYHQ